ncbi:MAG: chemotaxis protein CheB [Acidobacteriota bacterium]
MPKKTRKTQDRARKAPEEKRAQDPQPTQQAEKQCPVVGIGASAGGLEAFTGLLRHLRGDTGMAFVLVQHLDPKHESLLPELLSKSSPMPILQVRDGMKVEPDHVYVIPPNTDMVVSDYTLKLLPRSAVRGQHMPIDHFFRSLAADSGSKAIGIILSGSSTDGALGLEVIKGEGGITFAQDEKTAKYDGMPRAAAAKGCVDFILPPEGIARELIRIGQHPYVSAPDGAPAVAEAESGRDEHRTAGALTRIFALLRSATSVDFSLYKHTTIRRRISRRMALHKVDTLEAYVELLQQNPAEVDALYREVLIKVTGFFRDPEMFQALKTKVFPEIVAELPPDTPIRIWVPGCATGEEVYSIAIALLEFLSLKKKHLPIQIFATDISEEAIEKARAGVYLENIGADVSPERLKKFFVKHDGGYQVNKTVRDLCVFARQNLTKDPPFSKLDLISCRNVLIYLEAVLQKRVIPMFHYALKPSGYLLLGSSETITAYSDLFVLQDKKHKIYAKRLAAGPHRFEFEAGHLPPGREVGGQAPEARGGAARRNRSPEGSRPHCARPLCAGGSGDQRRLRSSAVPRKDGRLPRTGAGPGQPEHPENGSGRAPARIALRRPACEADRGSGPQEERCHQARSRVP